MEDYEGLIEDGFDAKGFANDLLIATNSSRKELDISTSIKRVRFDINNLELQMEKVSAEEHGSLINEIRVDMATKQMFEQLDQPLTHITSSYDRIQKDLLAPYNKALKTQEVLKKVHTTSFLLRSVTHFLLLIQQIQELQSAPQFLSTTSKHSSTLLKLANLHNQLDKHLAENPNLKSLKIIRDYEPVDFKQKLELKELITTQVRAISDKNLDSTSMSYLKALYALDQQYTLDTLKTILSNEVTISVNTLVRVLTSPRNISTALEQVLMRAKFIRKLSGYLHDTTLQSDKTLLSELLQSFELDSLLSVFWRNFAKKFEPKMRETMQRGGPVAKSLISYKDQIRSSIKRTVLQSDNSLTDHGVEVRMMLNSVRSLDR